MTDCVLPEILALRIQCTEIKKYPTSASASTKYVFLSCIIRSDERTKSTRGIYSSETTTIAGTQPYLALDGPQRPRQPHCINLLPPHLYYPRQQQGRSGDAYWGRMDDSYGRNYAEIC